MPRAEDDRARGAVVGAVGPGAAALAGDALRRLGADGPVTMELCVAGVALASADPWRIAVHWGPAGLVALAVAGGSRRRAERTAHLLAACVARGWRSRGFEGLGMALDEATAAGEALRIAVAGQGSTAWMLQAGDGALVSSAPQAFSAGARPTPIDLGGSRTVAVDAWSRPARLGHAA